MVFYYTTKSSSLRDYSQQQQQQQSYDLFAVQTKHQQLSSRIAATCYTYQVLKIRISSEKVKKVRFN